MEMKDRIRKARLDDGRFATGSEAARALGWAASTYLGYENGDREPSKKSLERLAKDYKVDVEWLMTGRVGSTPRDDAGSTIRVMGYIGAGATIEPEFEQTGPEGLFTVDLPFSVPDEMIGFEVRGDSMLPRYDEGDVIVVWREQRRNLETFLGEEAAVRTNDGRRFLKTITRGSTKAFVTLLSFNAKPIEDVRLEWIGEIYVTVRAGQIRRLHAKDRSIATKRTRAREKLAEGTGKLI